MSHTPRLVLKSACKSGVALVVLAWLCCSNAVAQKYAEQSGKASYSKSYASSNGQYKGTSYAQGGQGRASSYASSGAVPAGTSYARSFQSQASSYASSAGSGTSYASSAGNSNSYAARSSSYANSSKSIPYSQQLKLGKSSGGSILGIMRGAPAGRTNSGYSSNIRLNSASAGSAPVASYRSGATTNTAKATDATSSKTSPNQSIFTKLRKRNF